MIPPPLSATVGSILLLFIGTLFVFHVLLLWMLPLGERGWKRADYIWLTLAVFGLIGAAGEVRRLWADGQTSTARQLTLNAFEDMKSTSRFGNSYHCMKFNRTAFSPPNLDWLQGQYDVTCDWFKKFSESLPVEQPAAEPQRIEEKMTAPSTVTEELCRKNINEALASVKEYNQKWGQLQQVKADAKRSELELTFVVLSPYLLVVGLALRMTKVSGELRLIRVKADSAQMHEKSDNAPKV